MTRGILVAGALVGLTLVGAQVNALHARPGSGASILGVRTKLMIVVCLGLATLLCGDRGRRWPGWSALSG